MRMTEKFSCFAAAILFSLLAVLPGCGSLFSTCHNCPPPPPADNSGSWSGSIQVPSLSSGGNIDMAFVQSGANINSTRLQISSLVGPPDCGNTGTMTGSITGANISMTITENTGDMLSLLGIISSGAIKGTYSSSGTCTAGISGTFSFAQVPSMTSSQWSGNISSSKATTTFTANLTEDKDANLTGTVHFAGTACPNPVSVTGSLTGVQVFFQDAQGGSQVNASGSLSGSGAKNISGFAGGSCTTGGGGLTMTRP
jgi:hypothetical protein